jgi:hypothetical protein
VVVPLGREHHHGELTEHVLEDAAGIVAGRLLFTQDDLRIREGRVSILEEGAGLLDDG